MLRALTQTNNNKNQPTQTNHATDNRRQWNGFLCISLGLNRPNIYNGFFMCKIDFLKANIALPIINRITPMLRNFFFISPPRCLMSRILAKKRKHNAYHKHKKDQQGNKKQSLKTRKQKWGLMDPIPGRAQSGTRNTHVCTIGTLPKYLKVCKQNQVADYPMHRLGFSFLLCNQTLILYTFIKFDLLNSTQPHAL